MKKILLIDLTLAAGASVLPLYADKPNPGGRMTGNKISFLWGLVSFRDQ